MVEIRTSGNGPDNEKLMKIHKALYHSDGVDRLHVSRKGGRDILCIEDRADASIERQENS